jgi:hypothetical protein
VSIAGLLTLDCTITSRAGSGTIDDYGDETTDETTVTTVCELQQQQRNETTDPGTIADSTWLLILPAGTTIGPGDSVTINGDGYELVGEPWAARNPRTELASHVECTVKRVVGAGGT